ncbi:MAG: PLP-dependent aminotransferase family protein [Clostridium sp.]|nr:PLP-dependent aminotransferase family protein [Clostridium sp.]
MKELTLFLEQDSKRKLYEQIYDYMVTEIRAGRLLVGERLPSTRSLAEFLSISRSTVDLAYDQLRAEGYIEARPYRGYFVCHIDNLVRIEPEQEREEKPEQAEKEPFQIDFSPNGVDMSQFPFDTWRRITRNTLNDDRLELFLPGQPQGDPSLRHTIARYLHSARGVKCEPSQIIIGAGNDYLLMLLRYLIGEGRTVAMENPTYQRAYRLFLAMGFRMRVIGMDAQGMRADELAASEADVAYVMPSHQYPTGVIMPIGRRAELLRWAAEKEGRYVIEDDYDSEFRYRGKPIPSMQASDHNGRVIYIGTFSKAIAPAIRISYMVLPEELMERFHLQCGFLSSTVSRIDQATLNEFIGNGYFERYLNKMRKYYRQKHDMMLSTIRRWAPDFVVSGEHAGMHLLVTANNGLSASEMKLRAATMGIRVYTLKELTVREERIGLPAGLPVDRTVVMGFGGLKADQLRAGLRVLRRCWKNS